MNTALIILFSGMLSSGHVYEIKVFNSKNDCQEACIFLNKNATNNWITQEKYLCVEDLK